MAMSDDDEGVNCAQCREAVSARLDGEDHPDERAVVDSHLETCAVCREFLDRAAHITRLARTGVAEPVPDLVDAVRAAAPRTRGVRLVGVLRAMLAMVGVGQLALGINGVLAARASDGHHGVDLSGASLEHFAHESSAWNLALATGFLYVAWQTSRSAGLVPVLGSFVGVLTALSLLDLAVGRVEPDRLASHGLVVIGLVLVVALGRFGRRDEGGAPGTAASQQESVGNRRRPGESDGGRPSDDGHRGLKPTARHDAA